MAASVVTTTKLHNNRNTTTAAINMLSNEKNILPVRKIGMSDEGSTKVRIRNYTRVFLFFASLFRLFCYHILVLNIFLFFCV